MYNFGQNWIASIYPVPNDLVLDFVATATAEVYEVTVALHRVDWDKQLVELRSLPLYVHLP